mmetsp:Transcript_21896/g.59059  ORF Transcript_21896/g.59059 Transcript_21896/m.59059 type:complete len:449 (+) Transcript_21896:992-2338(+)
MAASFMRLAREAPEKPIVRLAMIPRSTLGDRGLPLQWTARIASRPSLSGRSTGTRRSKRPGRRSASSSTSARLVAAMTMTPWLPSKPSISVRIWLSVCSRSSFPPMPWPEPARWRPMASISSMKMMQGAFFFASEKTLRTRDAPTPTNISTNSEPEQLMKGTPASPATARARRVLPVPGGPSMITPRGILAPTLANLAGFLRNSTTSLSSSLDWSQPATSSKLTPVSGSSCTLDLDCPMFMGPPMGPMGPPCWLRERRKRPPRRRAGKAREPMMSKATLGWGLGNTLKRTLCFSSMGTRFLSPRILTARTTPSTSVAARRLPSSEKVTTSTLLLSTASRKSLYDHTPRGSAAGAAAGAITAAIALAAAPNAARRPMSELSAPMRTAGAAAEDAAWSCTGRTDPAVCAKASAPAAPARSSAIVLLLVIASCGGRLLMTFAASGSCESRE